jgi:signal transduction histidine kinase
MQTCSSNRPCPKGNIPRWLVALAAALSFLRVDAALLFYDGFDYFPGEKLGAMSSAGKWENEKTPITIAAGSLEYAGLKQSLGNRVEAQPVAPNLDSVRTMPGVWKEPLGGALYVSFLLRIQDAAGIDSAGEGTSLLTVENLANKSPLLGVNLLKAGEAVRLGVLKYPSSTATVSSSAFFAQGAAADLSVNGSTTYLVVAKYAWAEGETNDALTVWVNPTTLGGAEDTGNRVSTSTGPDGVRSAGRLVLSRGLNVAIDEVRIGQSWADVTPTPGAPRQWLATSALLAGGLVAAAFWITQLSRKVRERSAALRAQIQQRQKAEHQRMLEQERARIAHDLHDELGADITEISMLATRAQADNGAGEEGRRCLTQMGDKSRQMVAKLEEIVWAMNPQHDSLGALVSYFSFYADRFLGLANIKLSLDASEDAAGVAVEARARYQLFLVFKEALANVVKHSGATEARVAIRVEPRALTVTVADNGCGLPASQPAGAHEGISSMRRRMEKLGGTFEVTGPPGAGTLVRFSAPLEP